MFTGTERTGNPALAYSSTTPSMIRASTATRGERDAWAESVGSQFAAYINGRIEIGEVKKASLDLSMKKRFYIT
ncbi:hypothetical protein RL0807 [Rhizobium johnstonii 3841]|uniref:Uncharacterized protein n=1 Tax=Rhizobium johnstonii (strain DSM 114642 / LMG 32736 / 3841) TaxID=216596 RepID=Q1ML53_RHIJ3|nr:hypothetical protein RL0807 [Rhizobium johnstonii 3841]